MKVDILHFTTLAKVLFTREQRLLRDRLLLVNVNKDVTYGAGWLGQNDITQGQGNGTSMPPNQKVNKAEELTYLYTDFALKLEIV